jgi:hypothetical protein
MLTCVFQLHGVQAGRWAAPGGRPTSRDEILNDDLPAFSAATTVNPGTVSGRPSRNPPESSWAGSTSGPGGKLARPRRAQVPAAQVSLGHGLRDRRVALIRHGFTELGVQRVQATTMAVHIASWRLTEKAGLSLTRTFSQPWPYTIEGDGHGDVEYALTNAGWESQGDCA